MSERLNAIVAKMRIRPDDRILEIGCGSGVAATLICEQLSKGCYVAVDRSARSIEAARKRNLRFVRAGVAEFHVGPFESFDPRTQKFDHILAVRVRAFHVDPEASRALVQRWLAPGGKLLIEYDEPAAGQAAAKT